ncbi:hypothetical protein [Cellulomonas sp. ATA003]|uniref:hypothetical protein n=1 Tax=Cellulomonas sp. ATA003 TaxID=3073064 RepID=UPI0028733951|nr:hypothetical protein [Cellulomonas sp. ATA003]WNB84556.1 hypothetical protein REH70_12040 [Cellulomonas sp. ATA003]
MSTRADREGLTLRYRIGYRIRYTALHLFGPAQLGGAADPHARMRRERAARVAAARRRREAAEHGSA